MLKLIENIIFEIVFIFFFFCISFTTFKKQWKFKNCILQFYVFFVEKVEQSFSC